MAGTFKKNFNFKFEIGELADDGKKPKGTLLPISGGITNHDPDFEEESEDFSYYDLEGGTETEYTSLKVSYSFSGNRKFGDEGQEFIRDKVFTIGERKCFFQVTEPDGRIIKGPATIGEIKISGGDASTRSEFECVISFVGMPEDVKPTTPKP